jgi:hypothetical protein
MQKVWDMRQFVYSLATRWAVLQRKTWFTVGLFGLITATVASLVCLNAFGANHFKNGAVRFVPSEAVWFVVVPDIGKFLTYAMPSILEIARPPKSSKQEDLMSLVSPAIRSQFSNAFGQCTVVRDLSDLDQYGIDADSSFSAAQLDSGGRIAVKFVDERRGLIFLADALSPMYVQLETVNESESSENAEATDDEVTFEVAIDARNVDLCPHDDKRRVVTGKTKLSLPSSGNILFIPLRFGAANVNTASLQITCTTRRPDGRALPCRCQLFSYEPPRPGTGLYHYRDCSTRAIDLSDRWKTITKWKAVIDGGETATVGNFYVASIAGFHVVEQFNSAEPGLRYRLSEPLLPLDRDDSILQHFRSFEEHGRAFKTTIYGGGRPDWVLGVSSLKLWAIPLYLMTPLAVHFDTDKIEMEYVSNLKPQDMAIVQALANREGSTTLSGGSESRIGGVGAAISDDSTKLYVDAFRTYDPEFENEVSKQFLLAPVILDVMRGTRSLSVSVVDWNKDTNSWRLAFSVPGVTRDYASSLVDAAMHQNLRRQGRWITNQAAKWAKKLGYDPSGEDFATHVAELTCHQPYWAIKSARGVEGEPDKFLIDLKFDDRSLEEDVPKWVTTRNGTAVLPMSAPTDANVTLWGLPGGKGFFESSTSALESNLSEFADAFKSVAKSVAELTDPNEILRTVRAAYPDLLKRARYLEDQRFAIKHEGLTQYLNMIVHLSNGLQTRESFTVPDDWKSNMKTFAPMRSEDVKVFCDKERSKSVPFPVVYYDEKQHILHGFEQLNDFDRQRAAETPMRLSDPSTKLRFGVRKDVLAGLLDKSGQNPADIERLKAFPFPVLRFNLEGRESGAGVSGTVVLERGEESK